MLRLPMRKRAHTQHDALPVGFGCTVLSPQLIAQMPALALISMNRATDVIVMLAPYALAQAGDQQGIAPRVDEQGSGRFARGFAGFHFDRQSQHEARAEDWLGAMIA